MDRLAQAARALIVRDVCECDAPPEGEGNVTIRVDDLRRIVERHVHPTPAPLGEAEKALADLVKRLDAYADSEPSEPISAITRWPEWDAACKAHRAARTA